MDLAHTSPVPKATRRATPQTARRARSHSRECLRLFVEKEFQRCYDLTWSLVGEDADDEDDNNKFKHADAGAFAHVLLAFLYESYPNLFVHRQPFPAYMRTMLLRRAAEFDARSQEWMVNMLYSECACNSSLEKVRALCHFLLAIVLSGSYGKFSFTSADRSCSNGKIAARLLDPHVLTVIGGFKNLKYAASLGYCAAQRELGMMFLNGEKHPVNDDNAPLTKTEGMRLLRIAAEKGDPVAQVEAAMKLRKKDPPEAVRLLKLAAAQGFFDADVLLSQVYLTGPEHLRNVKEGLRIMSVAESVFTNKWMKGEGECYPAEMWASGFATLAQLYWDGTGVKKDVKEAARLLHLALQSVMSDDDVENTLKLEVIMTLGQLYYKEYHDGREQSKWMKLVLDSNTHPLFCLALGRS